MSSIEMELACEYRIKRMVRYILDFAITHDKLDGCIKDGSCSSRLRKSLHNMFIDLVDAVVVIKRTRDNANQILCCDIWK